MGAPGIERETTFATTPPAVGERLLVGIRDVVVGSFLSSETRSFLVEALVDFGV